MVLFHHFQLFLFISLLLLCCPLLIFGFPASIVALSEYAEREGAKCLDGSVPVYYFDDGVGSNNNKYLIWFEGGGWCHSHNGEIDIGDGFDSCYHRSQTALGSKRNKDWIPNIIDTINWIGKGYLSNNKILNPMMYDWNIAILRYCDGSSYSSDLIQPIIIKNEKGEDIKLYYRGYRIIEAFIKDLYYKKGLNSSTDIIISGESAGGLSVYLHIENINKLIQDLDKLNNINNHKYKIVGLIDSGIFPPTPKYEESMKWIYDTLNVTRSINEQCIKKEKQGYKCMFGLNLIKYIEIPLFIISSVLDRWQIDNQVIISNIDKIMQHSIDLEKSIKSLFNDSSNINRNALWLYRCYCHTGCFDSVLIHDTNLLNVFNDWYYGKEDKYNYQYIQQYEDYLCMKCEKLKTKINNLCIGFNQYPLDRYSNGNDLIPWNEIDFQKTMELVNDMNPSCVRINFYIEWFFDIDFKKQPFEHSFIHYSTKKMLAVFKILDWYKIYLPDTKIMTGLWNIHGLDYNYSSDEAVELIANLVKYLIVNKEYNIKYFTPINEPKKQSIAIEKWCKLIEKLFNKFVEYGISTDIITGPDSWDDYTWNVHWKCGKYITILDHHLYPQNSNEIRNGQIKTHLTQQILGHGLQGRLNKYKSIGLTEMSMFTAKGECSMDYPCDYQLNNTNNFIYVIDLADYFIQTIFSGHNIILFWCLDGFDENKNCGFWDLRNKKYKLRPWYFIFKLISKYFYSFQTLEIINIKQPKNGRILFIKTKKFWSILIINRNKKNNLNIKINLSQYIDIHSTSKHFIKYEVSQQYKNTNYTKTVKYAGNIDDNDNKLLLTIEIMPNSVVIISNKNNKKVFTELNGQKQHSIKHINHTIQTTSKMITDLNGLQSNLLLNVMYYVAILAILCAVALIFVLIRFYQKDIKSYYHQRIEKCN